MTKLSTMLSRPRLLGSKVRTAVPLQARDLVRRLPVRPDVVLYEAYGGRGVLCHPEALFRTLLDAPDLAHLQHVWVLRDRAANAEVLRELRHHPRVTFVRPGTPAYLRHVGTAGYLVNNATFPPDFGKREGQVYLNTWHGTPLKAMGYDQQEALVATRNVVRNFLMADYLLSSGDYMTERMYAGAYRLTNLFSGEVIDEGGPRTDRQVLDAAGRAAVRGRMRAGGTVVGDGETVVLYAPTWQGASFGEARDDALLLAARARELRAMLPPGHRVLLRVHQQVYAAARAHADIRDLLVPGEIPTNVVLGATDILVSDYSSIFFDFLGTGRPIVFFTPDEQAYVAERGVYLDLTSLPGPTARTLAELGRLVAAVGSGSDLDPVRTHEEARQAARARFAAKDDGGASERVVDIVFRGRREGRAVAPLPRDGRATMLVHLGGMKSNGITTSALGLVRHIDHSRFDVTAVVDSFTEEERVDNVTQIPSQVRVLPRIGAFALGSLVWYVRRELFSRAGELAPRDLETMVRRFGLEWYRCYGGARFDYAVDFSGYSPRWSFLIAQAPGAVRSIWLHNDLLADQLRTVDGNKAHEINLGGVFSSYSAFHHLVSVSPALRDINARSLSAYASTERFGSARNTIDAYRVLIGAGAQDPHPVIERDPALTTFVTVGRVSPEKNHERLVRAFAQVHAEHRQTRLVVVGDGPLLPRLAEVVDEVGLRGAVVLAGHRANPFAVLAASDVFVLSSDYEGQPMVILEAMVLGLPVVTTAFGSVASALPEGSGLIVEPTVDALADGLRAALRAEVPCPEFDAEAYNAEVMDEFYRAIGVPDEGRA